VIDAEQLARLLSGVYIILTQLGWRRTFIDVVAMTQVGDEVARERFSR
jgi:hypothetical protein